MGMERTILLVEDNPDDAELTIRALNQGKIKNKIIHVQDGVEALDFLFGPNSGAFPQIILLDLKLPKIDGVEVLKRVRADERTKLIPVVMLTSSREEVDVVGAYSSGANSYVCKPVDLNEFMAAVQQLGLYWLIVNESGH